MSSWSAINVAFDGEWEEPDVSDMGAYSMEHPEVGFDLLISMFLRDQDPGAMEAKFHEIAQDCGEIECAVTVSGSDTSDCFTFSLYEDNTIEQRWSNTDVDGWDVDYENNGHILDRIYNEIGRRPSFGGNYL